MIAHRLCSVITNCDTPWGRWSSHLKWFNCKLKCRIRKASRRIPLLNIIRNKNKRIVELNIEILQLNVFFFTFTWRLQRRRHREASMWNVSPSDFVEHRNALNSIVTVDPQRLTFWLKGTRRQVNFLWNDEVYRENLNDFTTTCESLWSERLTSNG